MGHNWKQKRPGSLGQLLALGLAMSFALTATAGVKDDVAYAGIAVTQLEIKNVQKGNASDTKSNAGTLNFGTYITDYFKAEFRMGFGGQEKEIAPGLSASIDQYYSGYFGAEYPVTDYMALYGMFGFTHLVATANKVNPSAYPVIPGDLVESSFSPSFLLGGSVRIYKKFHFFMDYGRLHADSLTAIDTKDLNFGVRYEY
ncbi:MAG: outer membrane beta-barrel protein [Hahellaceae bacterium]|nr:outer membrane beta-barrel protein [Hahellaceae bacterium]